MMRTGFFLLSTLLGLLAPQGAAAQLDGQFHAVVAVATKYFGTLSEEPGLARAVPRIEGALRKFARRAGYQESRISIQVFVDREAPLTRRTGGARENEIVKAVYDAARNASRPADTLVFFFSGHGASLEGARTILYATEADGSAPTNRIDLRDQILREIDRRSKASVKLVFIDACQTAKSGVSLADPSQLLGDGSLSSLRTQGTAIFFAAGEGETAWVHPELGYGFFTNRLVSALESGHHQTAQELSEYLGREVQQDVQRKYSRERRDQLPVHNIADSPGGSYRLYPASVQSSSSARTEARASSGAPPPPAVPTASVQDSPVRSYVPPPPLAREIEGRDGAPMTLIPAGGARVGGTRSKDNPSRREFVQAFYIDKYEVTVARYARFLGQSKDSSYRPADWDGAAGHDGWPVAGVNYFDALAYCRWAGKRLPSGVEWEKAARGDDGRIYPWGNTEPQDWMSNFNKNYCFACNVYADRLAPVGKFEHDKSPFGVYDMAGNVSEWVDEKHQRGSSWRTGWPRSATFMQLSQIAKGDASAKNPGGNPTQGFRCAANAPDRFPQVSRALGDFAVKYRHGIEDLSEGQKQTLAWILDQPRGQQLAEAYIGLLMNGMGLVRVNPAAFDRVLESAMIMWKQAPGDPINALKPLADKIRELPSPGVEVQEIEKFVNENYRGKN